MGQAKNRGTFEDRKEAAILRDEEAELERLKNPQPQPRLPLALLAALSLIPSR